MSWFYFESFITAAEYRPPRRTFGVVECEDKRYAGNVNRSGAASTTKIFPSVAVSKSLAAADIRPPYALSLITRAREQNVFYAYSSPPLFGADFRSGKSFGRRLRGRKRSSRVVGSGGGGVRGVD